MKKVLRLSNYSAPESGRNFNESFYPGLPDKLKLLTWQKNLKVKENRNC